MATAPQESFGHDRLRLVPHVERVEVSRRSKAQAITCDEIIVLLAEELGKFRALHDRESRWLERALREHDRREGRGRPWGPGKPSWTQKDDVTLRRLVLKGGTARDIARAMDKTDQAIRSRIRELRRRGKMELRSDIKAGDQ